MNESSELHVIANRAKEKIVLTRSLYKGCDLVNIRKMYLSRDGNEAWSREGIALHPHEVRELQRVLDQIFGPLRQMSEGGLVDENSGHRPRTQRNQGTLALQDQVLLHLANGLSPEDARKRVLGDDPGSKRRFTEIGKALRRSGLLVPGDWLLTSAGEARGKPLLGGKRRNQGEGEEGEAPYLVIPLVEEGGLE